MKGESILFGKNMELAEIYFKIFAVQVHTDITAFKNNYASPANDPGVEEIKEERGNLEEETMDEFLIRQADRTMKCFFFFRKHFFLSRVNVQGTVVFYTRRDERVLFGSKPSALIHSRRWYWCPHLHAVAK